MSRRMLKEQHCGAPRFHGCGHMIWVFRCAFDLPGKGLAVGAVMDNDIVGYVFAPDERGILITVSRWPRP